MTEEASAEVTPEENRSDSDLFPFDIGERPAIGKWVL